MKRYAILDNRVRAGEFAFLEHCQGYWSKDLAAVEKEFNYWREGIILDDDLDFLKLFDQDVKIVQLKVKEILK